MLTTMVKAMKKTGLITLLCCCALFAQAQQKQVDSLFQIKAYFNTIEKLTGSACTYSQALVDSLAINVRQGNHYREMLQRAALKLASNKSDTANANRMLEHYDQALRSAVLYKTDLVYHKSVQASAMLQERRYLHNKLKMLIHYIYQLASTARNKVQ